MKRRTVLIAVLCATLLLLAAFTRQASPQTKWEYKIVETRLNDNVIRELNAEGASGWELVSALPSQANAGFTVFYLKRQR